MRKFSWLKPSLARRIGIRMTLLAVAAIFLLTYQYIQQERDSSHKELFTQAELVLKITSLTVRDSFASGKLQELHDLAEKIKENPDVTMLIIYDKEGKILADSRSGQVASSQTADELGKILIALPAGKTHPLWLSSQLIAGQSIHNDSKVIGAICIGFSTRKMNQKINELTRRGVILASMFILIGAALTFAMAWQITTPLSELASVADAMKNGNLNVRAQASTINDEIGMLAVAFNEMAGAIQEREQALRDQADGLEKTINERTADLQEQARILEQMAITDPLTHAYNRRQFYKLAEVEMKRAQEKTLPLSVIVMDADHFKHINDKYGHQAGDQALIRLTKICHSIIRETDLFARYGGEEFVVLMPYADVHASKQIAERIRYKIEETEIEVEEEKLRFTISLGVSTFDGSKDLTFDSLLTQADRALYVSKRGGRNRVTHWADEVVVFN